MVLSVKDLLQNLVAIPSVNPAFQADERAIYGEARPDRFFAEIFLKIFVCRRFGSVFIPSERTYLRYFGLKMSTLRRAPSYGRSTRTR